MYVYFDTGIQLPWEKISAWQLILWAISLTSYAEREDKTFENAEYVRCANALWWCWKWSGALSAFLLAVEDPTSSTWDVTAVRQRSPVLLDQEVVHNAPESSAVVLKLQWLTQEQPAFCSGVLRCTKTGEKKVILMAVISLARVWRLSLMLRCVSISDFSWCNIIKQWVYYCFIAWAS